MVDGSKEILSRLDKIMRLLAVNMVFDKSQKEQIEMLSNVGFKPKEIADILGTSANTIRVGKSKLKMSSK